MINMLQASNGVDFGDMSYQAEKQGGEINSSTRGLFYGGNPNTGAAWFNTIEFITMTTTGNAVNFGDLSLTCGDCHGGGNATRGIIQLGYVASPAAYSNKLEFVTIATTGNSVDFGDLTAVRSNLGGASSPTRGVFVAGSDTSGNGVNTIDFVEIATLGNAVDFGDTDVAGATNGIIRPTGTSSNGHGGL